MQTLMVEHMQQMCSACANLYKLDDTCGRLCDFQYIVNQKFSVGSFDRHSMLAGIFVLEAMAETGCSAPFHFLEQVADYLSDKQKNAVSYISSKAPPAPESYSSQDFHLNPALSTR